MIEATAAGKRGNMIEIDELLNRARSKAGLKNDFQLSKKISVSANTIFLYREGVNLPTGRNMLALAQLAGLSPPLALVILNFWKAVRFGEKKDVEAWREIYLRLIKEKDKNTPGQAAA